MARPELSDYEISVKVPSQQLEFLESRAKELGMSKEELIRLYVVKVIDAEREHKSSESEQFSLMGIICDGRVTDKDIEEVMAEWNRTELP